MERLQLEEKLLDTFKEFLAQLDIDEEKIGEISVNTNFLSIEEIDSLDIVELVLNIEDTIGTELPYKIDFNEIKNVKLLSEYLLREHKIEYEKL
ncbi:hypothetical protein AC622_07045 [Bacillus sp. FJAT-27916]|uniref:acyl carrier protein n=1 Tax=Bacillus sp. FJAT-27916 TaxID=1679169 RepID=UPI0006713F42|nr:phosphopantetheine-binding protein [Bacillus sp. FJAT-27916]KMY44035.1 hypothetical protein AC622_07045 [Bacillus sp. FJAT-27916]